MRARLANTVRAYTVARHELELARARLTGGVPGKNAEEREAAMRLALPDQHETLERLEAQRITDLASWELAQLEVDRIKTHLRLLELPPT